MKKKPILDKERIAQIIRRMAFQIYENNLDADTLVFVGIGKQGLELSKLLGSELSTIAARPALAYHHVALDKSQPESTVELMAPAEVIKGNPVVLVDDVLNTGKTVAYSLMTLMSESPKKVELAVLVDRGHRTFPVAATYKGYELATTLEEHIEVKLGKNPMVKLY